MPEPIVSETGFVPGDGVETDSIIPSENVSPVIQQGREIVGDLFAKIGAPGFVSTETNEEDSGEEAESPVSSDEKTEATTPQEREGEESTTPQVETITLTQQELDRRVQAEADRRESVRNQRIAKAQRSTQNQTKLDRLREAGDFEGYVAEHEAQRIEDNQTQTREQETSAQREVHRREALLAYDAEILDPVVLRLPENERTSLLEAINPVGIEGRSKVLTATLDRLIEKAKAEGAASAEKALRNNAAFRKQVLRETRQQDDEPDLIPAKGRVSSPTDMNTWIRRQITG